MVVLAIAICTKSGKALLSRQFLDISRARIEGLLASFPKLMETEKQHTFIESESVRYVYHPLETLYLLLITSKASNIPDDIEILHLLAKLVPEYCRNLEEEEVLNKAFELIFAFDEVISLGYREKITVQTIKQNTEMDSYEERKFEDNRKKQQDVASKKAKEKENEIFRINKEHNRMNITPTSISNSPVNISGVSEGPHVIRPPVSVPAERAPSKISGLSLGASSSKRTDFLQALANEGENVTVAEDARSTPVATTKQAPSGVKRANIHIKVEEKIGVIMEKDGGLKNMVINGDCIIYVTEDKKVSDQGRIMIKLNKDHNKTFTYRTHPNINKQLFAQQNEIILTDLSRSFPVNSPVGVLKWRHQPKEESAIPFTINCWPSLASQGTTVVNLEYELLNQKLELHDVDITIPIPGGHAPVVNSGDGNYKYEKGFLHWTLPIVDSSSLNGSMEFTIPYSGDSSALFPVEVSFKSQKTFSNIQIEGVFRVDGPACPYSTDISLSTERYIVE